MDLWRRADRRAVDAHNSIAGLETSLASRLIRQNPRDLNFIPLAPSRETNSSFGIHDGSHRNQLPLAVAFDPNAHGAFSVAYSLDRHVLPDRIGFVVDLNDTVSFLNPRLGRGAIRHDVSD